MSQDKSSKFVPGLQYDDNSNTPTNSSTDNSIKIYDGVAECAMNEDNTLKNIKIKAKDLAIQKVQQKIADYVYAFWKDRYLTLPDDEVLSIAKEISNITEVKYNVLDYDDNILIRATVIAQVDDNDVMNYIIKFFKERTELKIQNEALRKENEELKRQISDLKQQLANNQQNTTQFITKDKIELASQKSNAAYQLFLKNNDSGAILLYDEAIKLNPNDAWSYFNRGMIYEAIGQYYKAIQDFSKAIQLNPNAPKFYLSRGNCYKEMRNMEAAQDDFNKYRKLS